MVAQNVAKQIEGRITYRKAVKTAIAATMRAGAEGIKVSVSGRLGGAEMARREHFKEGRTPLHTLRADIDYATSEAHTTYGRIGVKIWICRGIIYGRPDLFSASVEPKEQKSGTIRRNSGRGERTERGERRERRERN